MLNIFLEEAQRLYFANPDLLQRAFDKWTNLHKNRESLDFIQSCIFRKVSPSFVRITKNEIKKLSLDKPLIYTLETRRLENERNAKSQNLAILQNQFDNLSDQILNSCNNPHTHLELIKFIKNLTSKFQFRSDQRRHKKFDNLLGIRDSEYNVANVINRTDTEIPPNVYKLLQHGKNLGIGSFFDSSNNILEIEKLNSKFASTARQNAVSEHLIARIKGLSILAGEDINSCRTHDSGVAELKQFLKKHLKNILLHVDKSPDLIYVPHLGRKIRIF